MNTINDLNTSSVNDLNTSSVNDSNTSSINDSNTSSINDSNTTENKNIPLTTTKPRNIDHEQIDYPIDEKLITELKIKILINRSNKAAQKSLEWLTLRHNMLTSSEVATILDCNYYDNCKSLFNRKRQPLNPIALSSTSIAWGEKYEPIAKLVFESITQEKVTDIGLVDHYLYPWLGASPDGVVSDGRLLEIKCPYSRSIIQGKIPYHYWVQVQIQLEVCNFDECYFLQCKFEENQLNVVSYTADDQTIEQHIKQTTEQKNTFTAQSTGKQHIQLSAKPFTGHHLDGTRYTLVGYTLDIIKRDREWFANNIKFLSGFWNKLQECKMLDSTGYVQSTISITENKTNSSAKPELNRHNRLERSDNLESESIDIVSINAVGEQSDTSSSERKLTIPTSSSERKLTIPTSSQTTIDQITTNIDWEEWIAAGAIRNYLAQDPLLDWLNLYGKTLLTSESANIGILKLDGLGGCLDDSLINGLTKAVANYEEEMKNATVFQKFVQVKGIEFENAVIQQLMNRFPGMLITIAGSEQARMQEKYDTTITAMKNGTVFIHQAILRNEKNKTYGAADLLIRSDFINRVFKEPALSSTDTNIGCKFSDNWHYVVVDIKHTTLTLRSDGINLLNIGSMCQHKGQLYIYNECLSEMQSYNPNKTYLLGRKWHYTCRKEKFSGDGWFDRLGHIDYECEDSDIPVKTCSALRWIRRLRNEGSRWQLCPPSVPELYPNMGNDCDAPWHSVKKVIADTIGEITSLWYCGVQNRNNALAHGVTSWRQKECTSSILGCRGDKIPRIVDAIIDINRSALTNTAAPAFKPQYITSALPKTKVNIFLDFETTNNITGDIDSSISNTTSQSYLYMIGIGWNTSLDPTWNYKCLVTNVIDDINEKEIFLQMHDTFLELMEKYEAYQDMTVYHWSHAERTFYNAAYEKYKSDMKDYDQLLQWDWFDLCEFCRNECIVIRGAFDFSLKSMAKAMYNLGFIKTCWDSDGFTDGLNAMIKAVECSDYAKQNNVSMCELLIVKKIIEYNEVDCRTMMEILIFINTYMIDPKNTSNNKNHNNRNSDEEFDNTERYKAGRTKKSPSRPSKRKRIT